MKEQKLEEFFKSTQTRINSFLKAKLDNLPQKPEKLKEAMTYALLLGGKRARPFLVYATGLAFGGKLEQLDYVAAAVECIHAYSLVHDDMPEMDNDELRRGKETVHVKFGQQNALLAGDTLQALAFSFLTHQNCKLSSSCKALLCGTLAKAAGFEGMCGGQALDLDAEHKKLNIDELTLLHSLKTGALITAAIQMGYYAARDEVVYATSNTDAVANALGLVEALPINRELDLLTQYGQHVGLAFQVWDDVLDVIGDTKVLGKKVGADEALEKSTYTSNLGVGEATAFAHDLSHKAQKCLEHLDVDTTLLKEFAEFCVSRKY